jgi:hypothetical protein
MVLSVLEAFAVAVSLVVYLNCWCWVLEEAVDREGDLAVASCGSMIGVVSFCTSFQVV